MSKVQFDTNSEGDTLNVAVAGTVDEDSANAFPNIGDFAGTGNLKVDVGSLEAINSCGIREWVIWVKSFPGEMNVVYYNCPRIFVEQLNMIEGLIPANGKVESFFVPYYCDDSDHITNKLLVKGQDYNGAEIEIEEFIKCEKSGGEAELDIIESKYLKFLKDFG